MESTREKPLSKKEQEEEEMRSELANAGFPDENLSTEEMKELIRAVKASKNSSLNMDVSINESNSMHNTLETIQDPPQKLTSYKNNIGNDNFVAVSTSSEEQIKNQEKNSDLDSTSKKNQTLRNSPENESTDENKFNYKNDFPSLRNQSNSRNSNSESASPKSISSLTKENKKLTPAARKKMNLEEKWKLDPHLIKNKDATPLKLKEKLCETDRNTYSFEEDFNSDNFKELYKQMYEKLESLHEQFTSSDVSTRETDSQWGTVKVALKWNGSLDKNPVVEKMPDLDIDNLDIAVKNMRATKRKALSTLSAIQDDNYDDSDDEFIDTKKKKCSKTKKIEEDTKTCLKSEKNDPSYNSIVFIDIDKDVSDAEIFDNSDIHNLRKTRSKTILNSSPLPEQPHYPRRIPPPNPSKKSFKGPRAQKKNSPSSQSNAMKKKLQLNDEDITKTLNELDEQIDDNDENNIDKIGPLSTSKCLQNKINRATFLLENARETDEKKINEKEHQKKRKENEEKLKKDELISKRLQEQENEINNRIEKEKKFKEQEKFYHHILNSKSKCPTTRSSINKLKTSCEEENEDLLLADDDEPMITSIVAKNSSCPICQKSFPINQIESHASECDAFSSESDEINNHQPSSSRKNGGINECLICGKYSTYNGNQYEEHLIRCKEKAQDKSNGY